jgi:chemotaxis family two-component system response regulator Rcp1
MVMKPLEILLVEDNPGDVRLMMEALTLGETFNTFSIVSNGKDAMDFLRKTGKYEDAFRPDIILLDLNLPKKDGREVLQDVKSDPTLSSIPIIVLTTSQEEQDIARSYERQANCYISKPVDFEQFKHVVKSLENFWFNLVQLPQRGEVEWK